MRLDRWFRFYYPHIPHSHLNKLLRTGQVRIEGARGKTNMRLEAGQEIQVPVRVSVEASSRPCRIVKPLLPEERVFLDSIILFEDEDLLILNKPPSLAVQGGFGITRHLDGLLQSLSIGNDGRLLLTHRLDRDTSGVVVIAKSRSVASMLCELFSTQAVQKNYWALVRGVPCPAQGKINAALVKKNNSFGREQVHSLSPGELKKALPAVTHYTTIACFCDEISWVSLKPVTGRQHQLRVHMTMIGHPILGDPKYTGDWAVPKKGALEGLAARLHNRLHLHAKRIRFSHPRGGIVDVSAPLPQHMRASFAFLGFPGAFCNQEDDIG